MLFLIVPIFGLDCNRSPTACYNFFIPTTSFLLFVFLFLTDPMIPTLPPQVLTELSDVVSNQKRIGQQLNRLFALSLAAYLLEHPSALFLLQSPNDFSIANGDRKPAASSFVLTDESVFMGQLLRIDFDYVKQICEAHPDAIDVSMTLEKCEALSELHTHLNHHPERLLSLHPKTFKPSFKEPSSSPLWLSEVVCTPSPSFSLALSLSSRRLAPMLSPVFSEGTDGLCGEHWGFHLPILSLIQSNLQHVVVSRSNFPALCRFFNLPPSDVLHEAEQARLSSLNPAATFDRRTSRAL
jgi:hypothetical protein